MSQDRTLKVKESEFSIELESKKDLIKNMYCKGCSDEQMELFFYVCKRTGLNPLLKQIYAVPRGKDGDKSITIQTSIDGFRLIADRSGNYAPGKPSTFTHKQDGSLEAATAYVKKRTQDGTWHEVAHTVFYDEFVQVYNGKPTNFWGKMPHVMLSKVAESHALRKAFPAELSGIYSEEEMGQADSDAKDIEIVDHFKDLPELKNRMKSSFKKEELDHLETFIMGIHERFKKAPEKITQEVLSDTKQYDSFLITFEKFLANLPQEQ